jgi:hypothetical protein
VVRRLAPGARLVKETLIRRPVSVIFAIVLVLLDEEAIFSIFLFPVEVPEVKFAGWTSGKREIFEISDVSKTFAVKFSFPGGEKLVFQTIGETIVRNLEEIKISRLTEFDV